MTPLATVRSILLDLPRPVAVAVSGGIDSLTLSAIAHETRPADVRLYHAVSPAVPAEATARTRALAEARGWPLTLFDAGEFDDPAYRANPVDRCFFCKTNLYGAVAARVTAGTIVSGTNRDDLGEYRPGLDAAAAHAVRHPFVEAGIDKQGVRALARLAGLAAYAELPASPCLSSRVETGIPIDPATLAVIDRIETLVRARLQPATVRCRVRAAGTVIELDADTLAALQPATEAALRDTLAALTPERVTFAPYRNGSAFLRRLPAQAPPSQAAPSQASHP